MKKYLIICLTCCFVAVLVYMLCQESAINSLSDNKIQNICKDIALHEAQKDDSVSFRRQRDMEKICFCMAKAMPGSVTVKEFKEMAKSGDRSRTNDITNDCIEQLIRQGAISEEDV